MRVLGIPFFAMDTGPIRPLGKLPQYDEEFSKVLEEVKPAVLNGLIEVKSTYSLSETEGKAYLGAAPTGGYPLDPVSVFWLYRSMASNPDFLADAISHDAASLLKFSRMAPDLAPTGGGDGSINQIPALPLLDLDHCDDESRLKLTTIARSRLAAFIKYGGYCEAKTIVPIFQAPVYGRIAQRLINNAQAAFVEAEEDRFWTKRNRVLELCHEEFIPNKALDGLSVKDVLRLRTKAWGRQAEAREELFGSVFELSQETGEYEDFSRKALSKIGEYRKASEEITRERKKLAFEIKCDLGKAALSGGTGLAGLLSQIELPPGSVALALVAGAIWGLDKSKSYVPQLRAIRAKEKDMKRGAGFGLHNFYSRIQDS